MSVSSINLIQGDCLEKIKDIPDEQIDLIITSPPYDKLRTYNNSSQWNDTIWRKLIQELYRVTKQGGVVVWIVGDETKSGSESGTSFKQALWAKYCGFNLHDTMIWEKQTFTDTGSLQIRYAGVFEYMFVWSRGKPKTFNPIKDRPTKWNSYKKSGTIRQIDGSIKKKSSIGKIYTNTHAQRFNVWRINTEVSNSNRFHPAQFSEQIAYDHIISWSNDGDTILDPLMGSGTTGKIARQLNRNFIGIEIDEEYFKIAEKRINEDFLIKLF